MKLVFLMNPLETVVPEKDTSFDLMLAAQACGHEIFHLDGNDISVENGQLTIRATAVRARDAQAEPFEILGPQRLAGTEIDAILVRTDPPFDERYLIDTWLLDLLPPKVFVMNRPSGIRTCNEKIWANRFSQLCPETLVTADWQQFEAFLKKHGRVILKPSQLFGGQGIYLLSHDDSNARVAFESLRKMHTVVQEYLPAAQQGDKRILLLNGEPLGAVLRLHAEGEHRNNLFAGGVAQPAEIDPRDLEIIERLAPLLTELGLYFVGLDIIGGRLIEVNVTSPTCLREMSCFARAPLGSKVIEFVEKEARRHATNA